MFLALFEAVSQINQRDTAMRKGESEMEAVLFRWDREGGRGEGEEKELVRWEEDEELIMNE